VHIPSRHFLNLSTALRRGPSGLLGIDYREAFCQRYGKESSIRADYGVDSASVPQVQGHGELKTIECAHSLTRLWPVPTQESLCLFMMGDQQPRNREDLTSCVSQKAATELIEFGQGDEPGPSLPRENGKRSVTPKREMTC
jgi:hypothetical protein